MSHRITVFVLLHIIGFACIGSADSEPNPPLDVLLFASGTCEECLAVKRDIFPRVSALFGEQVRVTHIDIDEGDNFGILLLYEARYGVRSDETLKCFFGSSFLAGKEAIETNLLPRIRQELERGTRTPSPEEMRAENRGDTTTGPAVSGTVSSPYPENRSETASAVPAVSTAKAESDKTLARERFLNIGAGTLILAGLVDGINPCAFTTIVFFVSLLTALKRSSREILRVGLVFSLSVFGTYLAMGLGAFHALKSASVSLGISAVLSTGVGVLAFVFAVLSFRDAWVSAHGDVEKITLKLPHVIRVNMTRMISRRLRGGNLLLGAAVLGFLVSVLESVCTGQLYLPMIVFLLQDADMRLVGHFWLVVYNVMFVVPLLVVLFLTYRGLTSERLLAFSRSHVSLTKLLLGCLFLVMGILLLTGTV